MEIKSPAFAHGDPIPKEYTCDGANVSPPLSISGVPAAAKSLALISDDPDAPAGTWVHWVAWNIPPDTTSLQKGIPGAGALPDGSRQGVTDFRRTGYGGPCPPSGTHRYFFKLYALDTTLDLPAAATKQLLEKAMQGRVVAQAELMGRYSRR